MSPCEATVKGPLDWWLIGSKPTSFKKPTGSASEPNPFLYSVHIHCGGAVAQQSQTLAELKGVYQLNHLRAELGESDSA